MGEGKRLVRGKNKKSLVGWLLSRTPHLGHAPGWESEEVGIIEL